MVSALEKVDGLRDDQWYSSFELIERGVYHYKLFEPGSGFLLRKNGDGSKEIFGPSVKDFFYRQAGKTPGKIDILTVFQAVGEDAYNRIVEKLGDVEFVGWDDLKYLAEDEPEPVKEAIGYESGPEPVPEPAPEPSYKGEDRPPAPESTDYSGEHVVPLSEDSFPKKDEEEEDDAVYRNRFSNRIQSFPDIRRKLAPEPDYTEKPAPPPEERIAIPDGPYRHKVYAPSATMTDKGFWVTVESVKKSLRKELHASEREIDTAMKDVLAKPKKCPVKDKAFLGRAIDDTEEMRKIMRKEGTVNDVFEYRGSQLEPYFSGNGRKDVLCIKSREVGMVKARIRAARRGGGTVKRKQIMEETGLPNWAISELTNIGIDILDEEANGRITRDSYEHFRENYFWVDPTVLDPEKRKRLEGLRKDHVGKRIGNGSDRKHLYFYLNMEKSKVNHALEQEMCEV